MKMKFIVAALLGLLPLLAQAGAALPLKLAKDKGFTGCDALINKVFENSNGADVRTNVTWFDELKGDSIQLTTTSSNPGDSVYVESQFRKQGGKCFSSETTVLTSNKSCMVFKEKYPAFKVKHVVGEFAWAENAGGVSLILKDVGTGCLAILQITAKQ